LTTIASYSDSYLSKVANFNLPPAFRASAAVTPFEFCRDLRQQKTRRTASADRTARRQFQAVFPVITGSFRTKVIAHLQGLRMDLTVGRTVGPTVDSTVG